MGSKLSIHNDTTDTVLVKIGDDEEAVRIGTIITGVVAAAGLAVTGLGFSVGAMSGGLVTITASSGLAAAGTASSIAGATTVIVSEIKRGYISQGYVELSPGGSINSDKKTLSCWQQCNVVRH